MTKRRVRKTINQSAAATGSNICGNEPKDPQIGEEVAFKDREVERQSAAIRSIRDIEIEHLLTGLRLLHSYFSNDQLQTPVLQFFKENLQNLAGGGNIHASLLHRISLAYPDCSAAMPSLGDTVFSSKAVKAGLLGADNLKILEEPCDNMLALQNSLQTPGACSQRLSIGMTPKTLRVPKHGEMLLSVHGSPLGVYKEENMEAIHESEEG